MIELNRRGITRDVLLVGRWAIKWPTPRYGLASIARGLLANRDERDWSECSDGIAPVLWSLGGIVNVYPRCTPVTEAEVDPEEHDGPLGCPPPDRKIDNLGRLPDGRIVWVDYDYSWNGCPIPGCRHPLPAADEDPLPAPESSPDAVPVVLDVDTLAAALGARYGDNTVAGPFRDYWHRRAVEVHAELVQAVYDDTREAAARIADRLSSGRRRPEETAR